MGTGGLSLRKNIAARSPAAAAAGGGATAAAPGAPVDSEPLFSGDFGPVDESLGLHLSDDDDSLALPSPAASTARSATVRRGSDGVDFE